MFCFGTLLVACESTDSESDVPDSEMMQAEEVVTEVSAPQGPEDWEIDFRRQRVIGDLLYDALKALDEDRLLTPEGNNAYTFYQQTLALDPENRLALEGLQNIVARYLELAAAASRQGRFSSAHLLLDRARFVLPGDPSIREARRALEADMNSGDLVFELDIQGLGARSEALVSQLVEIAAQAVEHQAFVWITAPSDEQGRWIYNTMREKANGYRLRANIEIGSFAIVRLRMPENEPGFATDAAPDTTGESAQ